MPLALTVLECCEKNKVLPNFNFKFLENLYYTEKLNSIKEIYALAINYALRYFLNNPVVTCSKNETQCYDQLGELENTVLTGDSKHKQTPILKYQTTLVGGMSPVLERNWDGVDTDSVINVNNNVSLNNENKLVIALRKENSELKLQLEKMGEQLMSMTEALSDVQTKLNDQNKCGCVDKEETVSFTPSLNSTFNHQAIASIRESSVNWDDLTPTQMISVLSAEIDRVREYERSRVSISAADKINTDTYKVNKVTTQRGSSIVGRPNFINYLQESAILPTNTNSRITDWSMNQTFVNETGAQTFLDNMGNRNNFHSTFNVEPNQSSFSSLQKEDDATLTPEPPVRINPDLVNISTGSPYGWTVAAPVENVHKLVEISKHTLEGTLIEPKIKEVRFSLPPEMPSRKALRPRCNACGRPGTGEKRLHMSYSGP